MILAHLRGRQRIDRATLALRLGVAVDDVRAIEITRTGLLEVDTIRRYVQALGGRLDLVVVLDGQRYDLG